MTVARAYFAFTVDDVGDAVGSPADLREILQFLARWEVSATLFVVPAPGGRPITTAPEWCEVLSEARAQGHNLELHGLEHSAFEFGIPPAMILAYEHEERDRLERERQTIERDATLKAQVAKLRKGMEIFTEAVGELPSGFRAPWLATNQFTFSAIGQVGLKFDSSRYIDPRGWKYIAHDYSSATPWNDVPPRPSPLDEGIIEIPIMSEFTWHLQEDELERHLALAEEDLDRVREVGGTFVALSHNGVINEGCGFALYERLFQKAFEERDVEFTTLRAFAR